MKLEDLVAVDCTLKHEPHETRDDYLKRCRSYILTRALEMAHLKRCRSYILTRALEMAQYECVTLLIGTWTEAEMLYFFLARETDEVVKDIHFTPQLRVYPTGEFEICQPTTKQ